MPQLKNEEKARESNSVIHRTLHKRVAYQRLVGGHTHCNKNENKATATFSSFPPSRLSKDKDFS